MLRIHIEIEKLKKQLLALGALVEGRFNDAVKSIEHRDADLAEEIILGDVEIDQMEVDLEENVLKVLALYQPMAVDLREIVAILKINNDLERIGDLACDLAERAKFLATQPEIRFPFDFPMMAEKVRMMLQKSLDAFVHLDKDLARSVCAADDEVDVIHSNMFLNVEEAILQQTGNTKQLLNFLSMSRYLERIADHTTNIAEDVLYLITGEIVRHRPKGF